MSNIHLEILDPERLEVFKRLKNVKMYGVLGGGTAIAVQIKHRRSFDFDIFLILREGTNQIDYIVRKEIKITFLKHPFPPLHSLTKTEYINLFSLKDLASNKAATIGRRGVWRDYVDLFFLMKHGISINDIISETEERFGGEFNKRLFLEQLLYTNDITDFDIDYLGKKYKPKEINEFFENQVKSYTLQGKFSYE